MSGWFKPQICKKSEQLDQAQREKLNQTQKADRSVKRPLMMIAKGESYREKVEDKRREKSAHETDGCTFAPQVNAKFTKVVKDPTVAQRYRGELDKDLVFGALYEKRKANGPRQDRSPIEIEFEKQQTECSFKPSFMNLKRLQVSSPRINSGLRPV